MNDSQGSYFPCLAWCSVISPSLEFLDLCQTGFIRVKLPSARFQEIPEILGSLILPCSSSDFSVSPWQPGDYGKLLN